MASIRRRGNKWHVQVRRKGAPPLTRTFTRKSDAQIWANQIEGEIDRRGLPTAIRDLQRLTVRDLLTRYRDEILPHHRAGDNQAIILKAFLRDTIADMRLSDLSPSLFASYRDERLKTVRPATINRELGIIQHAFEMAIKDWGIPLSSNPVRAVRKPNADHARERRLYPGEWERLLEAAKKTRNPWLKPLVIFARETAMRRSELVNAKWRDVNWIDRTLSIPVTKNGHSRTIPLTPEALIVLASLGCISLSGGPIFPITAEATKLAWKRLTIRAAIIDLHFHDLRHEAVSRFFEFGLTLAEVALISGHRDPRMLFRYTHLKAEDVAKKLAGAARIG